MRVGVEEDNVDGWNGRGPRVGDNDTKGEKVRIFKQQPIPKDHSAR